MLSQKCIKKRLSAVGRRVRYSGVLHLARSLYLRQDVRHIPMVMATAYFDESESPSFSTVAGVVSIADKWIGFEADWKRMLDKFKVSALHMKDFVHSNGEFQSWKGETEKRKQFVSRVVEILSRRCMLCPGIVVNRQSFKKVISADPTTAHFYTDEYTMASFMSLMVIGKWAGKCGFHDPVGYVFDRGNPKRKYFQQAYDRLCNIPREVKLSRIGPLSFGDDTQLTPLQAADFVAYEFNKVCTDLAEGKKSLRHSLKAIMGRVPMDCRVPHEQHLRRLVAEINNPNFVWED